MKERVVIHPGFSKTATTLLQERVFDRLPGVCNLGKPGFGRERGGVGPPSWRDSLSHLRDAGPRRFDAIAMRDAWLHVRQLAGAHDGTLLVSHEGLTTNLFEQSWFRRKPTLWARGVFRHRVDVARRLKEMVGAATILFTIREQAAWFFSFYVDSVRRHGLAETVDSWLTRGLARPDDFLRDPDFSRIVSVYADIFGRRNVHVLLYEELISQPDTFARRFARACGIDESATAAAFDGVLEHRVKSRDQVEQVKGRRDRVDVPDRLAESLARRVRDHCRPGNRLLETEFGVDLAAHGYAV